MANNSMSVSLGFMLHIGRPPAAVIPVVQPDPIIDVRPLSETGKTVQPANAASTTGRWQSSHARASASALVAYGMTYSTKGIIDRPILPKGMHLDVYI
jgi:hypothetical protein